MYAKASFSTEEFETCDSTMAECASLISMPGLGLHWGCCTSLHMGILVHSFRLSIRIVRADYWLLPLSFVWRNAWAYYVCSDFRVFRIREGSSHVGATPLG